jgi:DNA-binding NarL/FixJ family response regulator
VAEQLSISERTAKAHLTSIFDKLGLRDRLQLSLKINGLTI